MIFRSKIFNFWLINHFPESSNSHIFPAIYMTIKQSPQLRNQSRKFKMKTSFSLLQPNLKRSQKKKKKRSQKSRNLCKETTRFPRRPECYCQIKNQTKKARQMAFHEGHHLTLLLYSLHNR